jgi:cytochrome c oxidase subunit 3
VQAREGVAGHLDPETGRFGMWLFLVSEVLLFGTLFLLFASLRRDYALEYQHAARELNRTLGALNTVVLLTSSLTVALGMGAMHRGDAGRARRFLWITIGLAAVFLVVKAVEWGHKFQVGLYPDSARMAELSRGEVVFFGLYYVMTGLHALHVVAGMIVLASVERLIRRGRVRPSRMGPLESGGLYWHLVDIIWIYLFPLFYLVGR